jgi:hypothetical protein
MQITDKKKSRNAGYNGCMSKSLGELKWNVDKLHLPELAEVLYLDQSN